MDASYDGVVLSADFKTTAANALKHLKTEYPFGVWGLTPVDKDSCGLIILCSEYFQRKVKNKIKHNDVFSWLGSLSKKFAKLKSPHIVNNKRKDCTTGIFEKEPIESYIVIPVYNLQGELFCTLYALDTEIKFLDKKNTILKLKYISDMLMIIYWQEQEILRLKSLNEKTELLAHTDSLTQLFNLRGWEKQLKMEEARCKRYDIEHAVAILDVDSLKKINDEHGHEKGDIELKSLAVLLEYNIRENDIAARIGGDEFGLFLYESDIQTTNKTIDRVRNVLHEHGINISVGVSQSTEAMNVKEMRGLADKRLYEEKKQKKMH